MRCESGSVKRGGNEIGCDESGWRRVLGVSVVDAESYES